MGEVSVPSGKDPSILHAAASKEQRAERYYNAAVLVLPGQKARLGDGSLWSGGDLYTMSIETSPDYIATAYSNLALMLDNGRSALIAGTAWNKHQLYIKSLTLDPQNLTAYVNLALLLHPGDKVTLGDGVHSVHHVMDRIQLLLKAIQIEPRCGHGYLNLGCMVAPGIMIRMPDGRELYKEQILAIAKQLDPSCVPQPDPVRRRTAKATTKFELPMITEASMRSEEGPTHDPELDLNSCNNEDIHEEKADEKTSLKPAVKKDNTTPVCAGKCSVM